MGCGNRKRSATAIGIDKLALCKNLEDPYILLGFQETVNQAALSVQCNCIAQKAVPTGDSRRLRAQLEGRIEVAGGVQAKGRVAGQVRMGTRSGRPADH